MEVEGKRRLLVLDTGARYTALNTATKQKCEASKEISTAFGSNQKFCVARVDWSLGAHKDHGRILFGPLVGFDGTGVDGVLGQDVLRTFSAVRIDYKSQAVILEERP